MSCVAYSLKHIVVGTLIVIGLAQAAITVIAASRLGLPGLIGADFIAFYTGGTIVAQGHGQSLYDLNKQREVEELLETQTGVPIDQHFFLAFDNPPLGAVLLVPFAQLPPEVAFVIWTAINVGLCALVFWTYLFRSDQAFQLKLFFGLSWFLYVPVFLSFFYGQMTGIVVGLMGAAILSLVSGRDATAGVALAVLAAIKPQYAVVLGIVLVFKWRVRALLSGAITGSLLGLASLVLIGFSGVNDYRTIIATVGSFRGIGAYHIEPQIMINWRGLLLTFFPWISDNAGMLLAYALGLVTIGFVLFAWRDPWQPASHDFSWRLLLTLSATLLASYHTHAHGAVLLLMPLLLWVRKSSEPGTVDLPLPIPFPHLNNQDSIKRMLIALTYFPPLLLFDLLGPRTLGLDMRWTLSVWTIFCLLVMVIIAGLISVVVPDDPASNARRPLAEANRYI
jgi:hypothetical protein